MYFRYLLLSMCCLLLGVKSSAQVSVEAKIDSISILVGEQTNMEVAVTARKGAKIVWPNIKPSHYLVPGVEIIDVADGDTSEVDNNVRISKRITLTSFDEKLYPIPGMKVKVDGKPYEANQLALKVMTIDVDTLHPNQFYPPKTVQNNPFLWSEWSGLFWMSVLVLALMGGIFYLYIRLRENKPIIAKIRIVKKVLPHQRALSAMEKIKAEHLERSDDQKTYYTQLTDALRRYIKERFGFNAMEMTSAEILYSLQESGDKAMLDELRNLFRTADLVKFAKYSTLLNENDMNLVNAINFIDQTKIEGQPVEERIVPTLSDDEKKVQNSRITIKTLLVVVGVIIIAMSAMIVYNLLMLLE